MIVIDKVTVGFGGVVALSDVTITLDCPVVGIIGPNGAGKTTLLNVLSGFVTPKSGSITAFGTQILPMPPHLRARWGLRRSFQREQVVDDLTVADNVRVVLDPLSMGRGAGPAIVAALEFVGLADLAGHKAGRLNAYQRRMVEIARCVAGPARLVLLDEPGAGFSQGEVARLRDVILGINGFCGARVLLIDHDVELIKAVCPQTMVLDFGCLIAQGPTGHVLTNDKVRAVYLGAEA